MVTDQRTPCETKEQFSLRTRGRPVCAACEKGFEDRQALRNHQKTSHKAANKS